MAQIKFINNELDKILKSIHSVIFVKCSISPIFTFSRKYGFNSKIKNHILNIFSSSSIFKYYIFLLGIKVGNKYHLNTVVYDKNKNIVYRFDPAGVDENQDNFKLKISLVDHIAEIFQISKSPLYKDNGTYFTQNINDSNCVDLCLKYIKIFLQKLD
jgi:hypothetical protein